MITEAPLVDAELARQRIADRERQKAHDQKLRGMFCVSTPFCLTLCLSGWLSREKKTEIAA